MPKKKTSECTNCKEPSYDFLYCVNCEHQGVQKKKVDNEEGEALNNDEQLTFFIMVKMSILRWRDLAAVVDNIPMKDLPTIADNRRASGAVTQIRTAIVGPLAELEKAESDLNRRLIPWREKAALLVVKEGDGEEEKRAKEEKTAELTKEANIDLALENETLRQLTEKYKKEEIGIELDGNYLNFLKVNFEKLLKPNYNHPSAAARELRHAVVETADALGIE